MLLLKVQHNNDGASSSITAPNSISQAEVIEKCWKDVGFILKQ